MDSGSTKPFAAVVLPNPAVGKQHILAQYLTSAAPIAILSGMRASREGRNIFFNSNAALKVFGNLRDRTAGGKFD